MSVRLLRLAAILAWAATAACASSGAVPQPFPVPAQPATQPIPAPPVAVVVPPAVDVPPPAAPPVVVQTALALRGTPYRNGGSDPSGFDCSGFVWYVFARQGIAVPRTVAAQFQTGRHIRGRDLRPGDLVFFETGGSPASHVGLVIGGDEFIHAPSSRGEVRVEHLTAPYWSSRFVGARRLL